MRELKDDKGKPLEGFVADYLIPVAVEKTEKHTSFWKEGSFRSINMQKISGRTISVSRELLDPCSAP